MIHLSKSRETIELAARNRSNPIGLQNRGCSGLEEEKNAVPGTSPRVILRYELSLSRVEIAAEELMQRFYSTGACRGVRVEPSRSTFVLWILQQKSWISPFVRDK